MEQGTRHAAQWTRRPLCVTYDVVAFGVEDAKLSIGRGVSSLSFCWALGALGDGQVEILGWWAVTQGESVNWSTIGAELATRGVEKVHFLVDPAGVQGGVGRLGCGIGGSAFAPRGPRIRTSTRQLRLADAHMRWLRIHRSLSRALLRRGSFDDIKAAAAFVDAELQRLDRRLWH